MYLKPGHDLSLYFVLIHECKKGCLINSEIYVFIILIYHYCYYYYYFILSIYFCNYIDFSLVYIRYMKELV